MKPQIFCSIDEYDRHLPEKLSFEQVAEGETYMLMGKVTGPEREAIKANTLLIGKIATENSQEVVLVFGDIKGSAKIFEKYFTYEQSGFLIPKIGVFTVFDYRYEANRQVTDSYLRNRQRDAIGPTIEQIVEKEIVAA